MATTNDPEIDSQEPRQGLQDDIQHLKERGSEQFEHYRDNAAEQIDNLAQNAQSAARHMADNDTLGLSGYASDLAQGMTRLAENLRGKNADELLQEAGKLARDNPLLFITGSVALGLGLSRVLKASMPTTGTDTAAAPVSPSGLAGQEPENPLSHTQDVLHSARPGTGIPASPAPSGLYSDAADDVSRDSSLQKDLSKGGL